MTVTAYLLDLQKWTLMAQLTKHGTKMYHLYKAHTLHDSSLNQLVRFLALGTGVVTLMLAFNMEWSAAFTYLSTEKCIPAQYPNLPDVIPHIGQFLGGEVDLCKMYQFGLPLSDGMVGGWSSWPMANLFT